jgi:hypothetical protein
MREALEKEFAALEEERGAHVFSLQQSPGAAPGDSLRAACASSLCMSTRGF